MISFKIDSPLSLILSINECRQITKLHEVAVHGRQSHQRGLSWMRKNFVSAVAFTVGVISWEV